MDQNLAEICKQMTVSKILLDKGIVIHKSGKNYKACCPLHDEKTPSFYIMTNPEGVEWFKCYGCGKHGDSINLLAILENKKNGDVIKALSKKLGIKVDASSLNAPSPTNEQVLSYLCDSENLSAYNIVPYSLLFLQGFPTDDAIDKISILYEAMDKMLALDDKDGLLAITAKILSMIHSYNGRVKSV